MPAITDSTEKVRLLIGDTDSSDQLLSDDQIDFFLTERGDNYVLAAADAAEAVAAKFSSAYDFTTDEQSFKRSQVAAQFLALAAKLRLRASNSASVVALTKVDGFSDDIAADDVGVTSVNPRRRFYGQEDRIP